jgi:polar amino acid transport system permease protein
MNDFLTYLPDFAHALWTTLYISLAAAAMGAVVGFGLNTLRLWLPLFAWPYRVYVWLIRGTPFLAQLFVFYFGLPVLDVTLDAVTATVLALTLYSGAYFAELFRSAWNSVPRGQLEAAQVHGVGGAQIFWHIQAPQALAFCLPLLGNQVILTIKESAVASIITVPELTQTAGQIVSNTYSYVVPYTLLVLSYWLLTQAVGLGAAWLAQRATRYQKG